MSRFRTVLSLGLVLATALACGEKTDGPTDGPPSIVVDYPLAGSVFPPEFVAPTFRWHDSAHAEFWQVEVAFQDGGPNLTLRADGALPPEPVIDPDAIRENNEVYRGTEYQRSARTWTPTDEDWQAIKGRSVESEATMTFTGRRADNPDRVLSTGQVRISVSKDPVGAPIFYRDVPLMPAVGKQGVIKPLAEDAIPLIAWRLRDVSKPTARAVLKNMPSCANCHSFSRDGSTLGMDVDGPSGDKGAYMIAPVTRDMVVTNKEVITWNSFENKPKGHKTIGFLSRVSPDGKFVVTTLNESLYVTNFKDYKFLQVFYPTRGILAVYSSETGEMKALPGADDPNFVHCAPTWTSDGKVIVFSRAPAFDPYSTGGKVARFPNDPAEPQIRYNLYRMHFNEGRGGTPVPIKGASHNGMSNSFPKISPDGKWVVWTKCRNGQLMRPDGRLWIVPLEGGEAREMNCNTSLMNSWHSFSPNSRWMVFSSKVNTPYTQMFLTHIDEDGNDTPAILIPDSTADNRAVNIPEFVNGPGDVIKSIEVPAVDHHRLLRRAARLFKTGQFKEALPLARKALEEEPDFGQAQIAYGWALVGVGRTEEGIREFRKVLERDMTDPPAHHHLGLALAKLGRTKAALRSFEKAVEYGDGYTEARKSLGLTHYQQKDLPRALAAYRKAASIQPGDPTIHESLSVVLFGMGKTENALEHLYEVCMLSPGDAKTRMILATHLATNRDARLRKGQTAVQLAKEACVLTNWRNPTALDVLAAAYAEIGSWEDAVETAARGRDLARRQGDPAAADIESRMVLYQQRKPLRQDSPR